MNGESLFLSFHSAICPVLVKHYSMHRKLTRTGLLLWLLHASDPVSGAGAGYPSENSKSHDHREPYAGTHRRDRAECIRTWTDKRLRILPVQRWESSLSRLAGIYLLGAGQTPGSNQTIFMRGSNSNQTAIYLDGVRINDVSSVNGVADLSELPLSSLDRIETLRGSHSTVFGSAAVGGVILLQSRGRKKAGTFAFGTGAGIFAPPEANGIRTSIWVIAGRMVAGYPLPTELLSVNSLDATVDTTDGTSAIPRDRDDWKKQNFSIAGGWTSGNWSSQIRYRRTGMQTDIDRSAYTDDDNYNLDFTVS